MRTDLRAAPLSNADREMLDYAVKLTKTPAAVGPSDLELLRAAGFDDEAIHEIVQITALFAYYNRLADGLGVELEPEWK